MAADPLETSEILRGLRSRNLYDQYFAVVAMEQLERADLLPHLTLLFRSNVLDVRIVAIRVIGTLGTQEPAFYSALLKPLLQDPNPNTRYETATALGRLGSQQAYHQLRRLARTDPDPQVRKRAARSARLIEGHPYPGDETEEPRTRAFNPLRFAA